MDKRINDKLDKVDKVDIASLSKDEQDKVIQIRQMKAYLGWFFLPPEKGQALAQRAQEALGGELAKGFLFRDLDSLRRFGQAVILSYGKRVSWKVVNTYELEEAWFQKEPVVDMNVEPELLFITFLGNEVANAQLFSMANTIIGSRTGRGKRTFVLSLRQVSGFTVPLASVAGIAPRSREAL